MKTTHGFFHADFLMQATNFTLGLGLTAVAVLWSSTTRADLSPGKTGSPNLDQRAALAQPGGGVSLSQQSAAEHLRDLVPQARVDFDPVSGSPRMVGSTESFLSGANGD